MVDPTPHVARRLWWRLEPIHAVTYFTPESRAALEDAGLRGFWRGYFAGRAAPFGRASAELVTATFFNFRPSMVARAVPAVWDLATPEAVVAARLAGAVASLEPVVEQAGLTADDVAEAAGLAEDALVELPVDGRPLYAALTSIERPTEPLARLWHAATLLREHRGDGHIAALVTEGLSGLGAHLLFVAVGPIGREVLQASRGWTDDEWDAELARLVDRGLVTPEARATDAGRALRADIERRTDELAAAPWDRVGPESSERLRTLLAPLSRAVVAGGLVPALSPVGDLAAGD